ncbi:hypothetical protein [Burkholderia cenocepacia]|uniref:Uncharacterized protein n=1 Tax=Burkholderia cenocepacia TaxID=95486 RepID=A0A1V2VTZ5_9BURK|nr:hypothetical protein [Burkholderia cenocepacia]ONU47740.1 hypothetical protein A8E62_31990 [Burkholderia cenocepacia]ONU66290.1 hypothetical protein A8E68_07390 [Burkholderia cenocepacia]ONU71078.1 hypothetical protein A8E63_40875 [Burkholderia cenocepacia]ONU76338.1 hypothetical protein A8E72_34055 [Burkholderia cenocepacia]ONU79495.1 hypothetical protein A8E73_22110 [Burkholderia cenocepacia]
MWNLEELKKYLDKEKLQEVTSEQLEQCHYICDLLSGVYDIELRNDTFSKERKVDPVQEIREGDLCIISTKKYPTPEEFAKSLEDKSPAMQTNMKRAYDRGEKMFYDNGANKAFNTLLKRYGYLHSRQYGDKSYTADNTALKPIKHSELKIIFSQLLERFINVNMHHRNELALKLIAKDANYIHFATKDKLADMEYCLKLLHANPNIDISFFDESVTTSWEFVSELLNSKQVFAIESMNFPKKIKETLLFAKLNEDKQENLLFITVQFFLFKEKFSATLKSLPGKPPFEL